MLLTFLRCYKTCYPPNEKQEWIEYWKPDEEHYHHGEHHYKPKPKVPCHKCHPKKPECYKGCKPSPCHKCRPEHKGCNKVCKPSP